MTARSDLPADETHDFVWIAQCPECKEHFGRYAKPQFCPQCGIPLDWSK